MCRSESQVNKKKLAGVFFGKFFCIKKTTGSAGGSKKL